MHDKEGNLHFPNKVFLPGEAPQGWSAVPCSCLVAIGATDGWEKMLICFSWKTRMRRIRKRHRVQSEDNDNDNEDKNNDNLNEDNDSGDNDNEINQDKDNKDIKVQNLIIAVCTVYFV